MQQQVRLLLGQKALEATRNLTLHAGSRAQLVSTEVLMRMLIAVCSSASATSAVGGGGSAQVGTAAAGAGGGMALVLLFATEAVRTLARDAG
jgi:hypothetical protein